MIKILLFTQRACRRHEEHESYEVHPPVWHLCIECTNPTNSTLHLIVNAKHDFLPPFPISLMHIQVQNGARHFVGFHSILKE